MDVFIPNSVLNYKNTDMNIKHTYLSLATLLLLCLAPMPYGYFMLVRFVMMVTFGWMAYRYYEENQAVAAEVFAVLALLFQPIYKIALGRTVWNVVDVMVAVFLIVLFIMEKRLNKKGKRALPAVAANRAAGTD